MNGYNSIFFNKSMFIKFGIKIIKIQKDTGIKDKT